MKVISLWQPWASLIVEGKKHIETRSWATSHRGPTGIHAAQRCPLDGLLKDMDADRRHFVFEAYGQDELNWIKTFPTGVILGYANLIDCILITEEFSEFVRCMTPAEYAFGDFTHGRYAWVMDDPIKLPEPIPAKGMQWIWEYDIPIQKGSVSDGC